jgi:hypothetical protein
VMQDRARPDAEGIEIGANQGGGGAAVFDEDGPARAAAERFDSNRAGSGIEIGEGGAFNARRQNVKQRLAKAVRRGARVEAGQGFENSSAKLAGDDAHVTLSPNGEETSRSLRGLI